MAGQVVSEILVGGPASVLVGAYGAVEGACVNLGYTQEGAKINFEQELFEKHSDQNVGILGLVKTSEKVTIEIGLAQASLDNLALVFGYPTTAVSGVTLNIGGDTSATERTVYINGVGPGSGATRKATIHKCVVSGNPTYAMTKDGVAMVMLTLLLIEDTAKAAGERLFSLVDSGTDTTPPTVAMSSPAEDGTVVAGAKTVVQVVFTEAGAGMDEGSMVYGESVQISTVEDPAATAAVAGTLAYNATTKVLTFTPTNVWAATGQNYQLVITRSVRDMAGLKMAAVFYGHFVSA